MKDSDIQAIVDRVMREVGSAPPPPKPAGKTADYGSPPSPAQTSGEWGAYPTLDEAVAAAQTAFQHLNQSPLSVRQQMIAQMRRAGREYATVLADLFAE
jgi:hypothetical protein